MIVNSSKWVLAAVIATTGVLFVPTAAAVSFDSSKTDPTGDVFIMSNGQTSTITGADLVKTESRAEGGKIVITATTLGELPADRDQGNNVWYFTARAYTNPGYKIWMDLNLRSSSKASLMIEQGDDFKSYPIEFAALAKGATLSFDSTLIPSGVTCWSILGALSFTSGKDIHMDTPANADPKWKDPCNPDGSTATGGDDASYDSGSADSGQPGAPKSGRSPGLVGAAVVAAIVVAAFLRRRSA